MAADYPKWSLQTPPPALDKSKWANVEKALPIDPRDSIELARAIRAAPELWAIFEALNPDDCIPEKSSERLSLFCKQYFDRSDRAVDYACIGPAKYLLRLLHEGRVASLENVTELIALLTNDLGEIIAGAQQ
jgi:hypothetical protein